MMLWRTISVSAAVVGCCALAACGSQSTSAEGATTSAASPSSSQVSEAPVSAPAPPASAPVETPAPAPAESPVAGEEPEAAPAPAPGAAAPAPGAPAPESSPIDARSPEQVLAESGDKGQRYLGALRAAGIPPAGMDAQEILYAQGLCQARADGASRAELLSEFDAIGQAYSKFTPLSSGQVAEAYVSTAEQKYC